MPRPYQRPWVDSGADSARLRSAAAVVRFVTTTPEVLPEHRDRVITDALWYVTEGGGKYATRYRSEGALALDVPGWRAELRHDHVVTRKELGDRLRTGEDAETVLADAVACVVTRAEHDRLSQFDRTERGWDRYRAADVKVIDTLTGARFI